MTCSVPGCQNDNHDTYGRLCEDHWALAQPFFDPCEPTELSEFDGRSEKLEAVAA